MKRTTLLLLTSLLVLNACNSPGDLDVHQAWVRPTAAGDNAAVYLTLHNHSSVDDELIGATATVADVVEIHETSMDDGVMKMEMISSVPVAADEEIIFTPGGFHLMLVNIKEELTLGDHIGLILHFRVHEDIVVEVHIDNEITEEDHDH
jgi:copper(I)-binding protein